MSIKEMVLRWYTRYIIKIREINKVGNIADERKEKIKENVKEYEKVHNDGKSTLTKEQVNMFANKDVKYIKHEKKLSG